MGGVDAVDEDCGSYLETWTEISVIYLKRIDLIPICPRRIYQKQTCWTVTCWKLIGSIPTWPWICWILIDHNLFHRDCVVHLTNSPHLLLRHHTSRYPCHEVDQTSSLLQYIFQHIQMNPCRACSPHEQQRKVKQLKVHYFGVPSPLDPSWICVEPLY
jgi:hypothetical protein